LSAVVRVVYRFLAALFLAGVVLEFFLAGLGVFRTQLDATAAGTTLTKTMFDHSFEPHLMLGDILFGVSLLLLVAALLARIGRRGVLTALGLLVLLALQATFAFAGPAGVRALHPVLALLVLGTAASITFRAFRGEPGRQTPA